MTDEREDVSCTGLPRSLNAVPTDISYPQFLLKHSMRYADRLSLIDGATGEEMTYRDFWRNTDRFAGGLRAKGFQKGDRICVVAANCIQYPVIYFGIASIGGVVVPLNPLYTSRELLYFFENAESSAAVTTTEALDSVLAASRQYGRLREIFVIGDVSGYTTYDSLLRLGDLCNEADPEIQEAEILRRRCHIDPQTDLIALTYSSGTTGLPKGCMHTHYNFIVSVTQMSLPEVVTFDDGTDVTIATVPMYHMYGVMHYFGLAFLRACTMVVMPRFQLENYLQLVEKYMATVLVVVPPILSMVAESPLANKYDLTSIRMIVNSAAPLRASVVKRLRKHIPQKAIICEEYGMTECLLIGNNFSAEDFTSGCVGERMAFVRIKIVDTLTRRSLGPNEQGEICVQSPATMVGYWKDPEATKAAFDDEGFMSTGDIGYYDECSRLHIVDRIKDVMKYKGFQVNPGELEAIILSHPRVKEAAVVGRPDEISGDLPMAFVVVLGNVKSDQLSALGKEIASFVSEKVSPQKYLRGGIRFVESIPKSPSGKVLRRELRQMLMDEFEKVESYLKAKL